jgi:hypothetical protein
VTRSPTMVEHYQALLAERDARFATLTAERDELQDRLDTLLPPLTPDFAAAMLRLDDEVARLAQYRNSETGQMSTPAASRNRTLEVIHTARHMLRYANDAERGNVILRAERDRYLAVVEAAKALEVFTEDFHLDPDEKRLSAALTALAEPEDRP